MSVTPANPDSGSVPLCVDLDGTLIRGDLLWDGLLRFVRKHPQEFWRLPLWLVSGRVALKAGLAQHAPPAELAPPSNSELIAYLHAEAARGRRLFLVTASHRKALGSVVGLAPFEEILATDDGTNLKGRTKAQALVSRFGEKGFDYAGNSKADEAVWQHARKAIVVHRSERQIRDWSARFDVEKAFVPEHATGWRDWVKALRIHQWSKNLLITVPFLAGHHFHTWWQLAGILAAFLSMSLCASATYLWNDLLDTDFDRAHRTKSKRLVASGRTSVPRVLAASGLMMVAGLAGALMLKPAFATVLIGYIVVTLSYSLHFKRVALADIFLLAFLYLARVIAGLVVSEAKVSFWLFSFTFLLFLSLAAVKRFVEVARSEDGGTLIPGRGYSSGDLDLLSELGTSTGIASVVVLGLYSNSEQVVALYRNPEWFWGVCLVAFYWICRTWMLTRRGEMHDDPVVFALKDRTTWFLGLIAIICVLLARPL
jgi:4-hydroxybenzoate polyprenyltransferase